MSKEELFARHKEIFGKLPVIIGVYFDMDEDYIVDKIEQAILEGTAYDEYKHLTKEEQKLFTSGLLLF